MQSKGKKEKAAVDGVFVARMKKILAILVPGFFTKEVSLFGHISFQILLHPSFPSSKKVLFWSFSTEAFVWELSG